MTRAIICGGRDFKDWNWFASRLALVHVAVDISEVIEGGARGADSMARFWAKLKDINCVTVEAEWDRLGRSAGYHRNVAMIGLKPDLVIATPGGVGTRMMVDIAKKHGVRVILLEKVQATIKPDPSLPHPSYLARQSDPARGDPPQAG